MIFGISGAKRTVRKERLHCISFFGHEKGDLSVIETGR